MTKPRDELFNTFLHGELEKIARLLSGDNPPFIDATRLSAIITNICNKSDGLHARIVKLEKEAEFHHRRRQG